MEGPAPAHHLEEIVPGYMRSLRESFPLDPARSEEGYRVLSPPCPEDKRTWLVRVERHHAAAFVVFKEQSGGTLHTVSRLITEAEWKHVAELAASEFWPRQDGSLYSDWRIEGWRQGGYRTCQLPGHEFLYTVLELSRDPRLVEMASIRPR